MTNFSDHQLFEMIVREGSLPAYNELFRRYWEKLYIVAYARLQDGHDAKDCVQDLFFVIWSKRDTLPVPLSVPAYLFTAMKNRVLNTLYSRTVQQKHLRQYAEERHFHNDADLPDTGYEELAEVIRDEVARMPPQMRKIYLLSRDGGMTGNQIADSLSLSPQTVRNQISTALKRIKDRVLSYQAGI